MKLTCRSCGRQFGSAFPAPLCRVCYFERAGDFDMALAEEAWRSGFGLGYQRGHADGVDEGEPILPASLLDSAIALCHPDRHPSERFRHANAVTADLLAVRERIRKVT